MGRPRRGLRMHDLFRFDLSPPWGTMTSHAGSGGCDQELWESHRKPGRGNRGWHSPPEALLRSPHFWPRERGPGRLAGSDSASLHRRDPRQQPGDRGLRTPGHHWPKRSAGPTPRACAPPSCRLKLVVRCLSQSEVFFQPGPASFVRRPASRCLQGNSSPSA